jgi:hypothetical protein
MLSALIIVVNSHNVCVFSICIFSIKLDLLAATCIILFKNYQYTHWLECYITLGKSGLPGTNTLTYCNHSLDRMKKDEKLSVVNTAPGGGGVSDEYQTRLANTLAFFCEKRRGYGIGTSSPMDFLTL